MDLPFSAPPASLCLLRLSALGDVCHTVPILRTIQRAWPRTQLTWIIGRVEHGLLHDVAGVEFVVFDKSRPIASWSQLHRALQGRSFDALLQMQISLRASLASMVVASPIRLGFDRARAKQGQWLLTNHQIASRPRQHVLDGHFGFPEALGIRERVLAWNIPIPDEAQDYAKGIAPADAPLLVISPCASFSHRNWHARGYAAVADYAAQRYGMRVVLTGGGRRIEREMAAAIVEQAHRHPLDLVGKTTLKQTLALLARARVLVAPDSGPVHMATAVGTPVIGLYAASNPARTGPYLSHDLVIDQYPTAVRERFGRAVEDLPWGIRVRDPGTMERITVESVTAMLDRAMNAAHKPAQTANSTGPRP